MTQPNAATVRIIPSLYIRFAAPWKTSYKVLALIHAAAGNRSTPERDTISLFRVSYSIIFDTVSPFRVTQPML